MEGDYPAVISRETLPFHCTSNTGEPTMDASENPYAPPPLDVEFATAEPIDDDAERIRREYLSHEASIRTIGILYYFGGGFLSLCCLGGIAGLFLDVPADRVELLALAGLYGALATLLPSHGPRPPNTGPLGTLARGDSYPAWGLWRFPSER